MNATNSLAGDAGIGKSRALAHLMVAVAAGLPFLGHETHRTPVLFMNFDDAESMPKLWAARAARGLDIDHIGDLPLYYWNGEGLPEGTDKAAGLTNPHVLESILSTIELIRDREGQAPGALVLDTFETGFPSLESNDANDALKAHRVKMKLVEAADGACFIESDHTAKRYEGLARSASGSMQKKAKVRALHALQAVDTGSYVASFKRLQWHIAKNNAGPQETFYVRFHLDEDADADYIEREDAPVNTRAPKKDTVVNFALDALKDAPGAWLRRSELMQMVEQHTEVSNRTASSALQALEALDEVEVKTEKGQGNPKSFRYVPTKTMVDVVAEATARDIALIN